MSRFILPIILVVAAIGLFVLYTNPSYEGPGGIKDLKKQAATYDDALNKSQELKSLRQQLLSAYNAFSPQDKDRLDSFLPDNVDNIRLVIDINNIAARHSLAVKSLALGDTTKSSNAQNSAAVGASGPVGSVELGFTVSANYNDFLAFLSDLEHSLRLIDVERITFSVGEDKKGLSDYAFTIRTYWLH